MDLASYLQVLPKEQLGALYESPWTCNGLLRALLPLSRVYITRLLLVAGPIHLEVVDSWPSEESLLKHKAAIAQLTLLQLLLPVGDALQLHQGFQNQLHAAICGGASSTEAPVPPEVLSAQPQAAELEAFVVMQWEGLLLYVANAASRAPPKTPPLVVAMQRSYSLYDALDVDELLLEADLVGRSEAGARVVSQVGTSFLLRGGYAQLWALLKPLVSLQQRHGGAELAGALSFVLRLGFRGLGRPLPISELPAQERRIAAALATLGLLCPFKVNNVLWAAPTRLASELSVGSSAATGAGNGSIVVETNYRVYAFTSSPLHIAILRLFVRCDTLLPTFFVGTLTRDSVGIALRNGLTADEIVAFLAQHAHSRVARRAPIVPEVVSDQIRLWQKESERVTMVPAFMYSEFENDAVWRDTCTSARSMGGHLWQAAPHPPRDGQQGFKGAVVGQAAVHPEMRLAIRASKQREGF